MRFRSRTWFLLSLLLLAAAYWVGTYAQKVGASRHAHAVQVVPAPAPTPAPVKIAQAPKTEKAKSYHLSNTRRSEKDLIHSDHAIILRNALIDTDRPLKLDIPAHLRAKGAPGSYIVQSERALDQRFYDLLARDGVKFISYIPNNAALVQATPDQARQMASDAQFQAVVPYEPYYKLAPSLLPSAVAQDQPFSQPLNVTALPGQRDAALAALKALGAQLMGEDTGPFGTTLSVMVPPGQLVAVAQLPLASEVETYTPRRVLNDLSRVIMNISTNTLYATPNYLNLTGSNVMVNLNDTGVDTNHPDFQGLSGTLRLLPTTNFPYDLDGHGTHVGGSIAGNGSKSSTVSTIVPGETTTGAGFQGKATNAVLFVQGLDLVTGTTINDAYLVGGSLVSDAYLQTNASVNLGPTNLISNNSWGYVGANGYDLHAASFDQATRDAQPNTPGEQPMLFVFAAGGEGNGNVYGEGGAEGSIVSPATAKNVITVGSLDEARFITNGVTFDGVSTNDIFFPWTDNDQYVAWFSSCGNIGAGTEGTYGRFKPDVVAPGVFTISCRATNYVDPTNATYVTIYPYPNQQVMPGETNDYPIAIPADTEELAIVITPNPNSPTPFPNLLLLGDPTTPPITVRSTVNFVVLSNQLTAGEWYFGVESPAGEKQPVSYDLTMYLVETNDLGVPPANTNGYYTVISNLNSVLKPWYVYQYGTSMSAGAVSGMLALMQEFLQSNKQLGLTNPSPALLKAMLINGSRSAEEQYDFNTQALGPNEQGWGLPNLTNTLPTSLTNGNRSMLLTDQSTNVALATGQSQSYTFVTADSNATNFPIRITLVWTDPPGDPPAGIALVNNLDLVVTDSTGTNIWLGNDFYSGDVFTEVNTGNPPDAINNVQNVYIDSANTPFQFPLKVSVLGMRVNVNATTTLTNLIAQDYALVISSDDTALTAPLTIILSNAPSYSPPPNLAALVGAQHTNAAGGPLLAQPLAAFVQSDYVLVTVITNGSNYLHQRVGANEPNLYTNGILYTNLPPATSIPPLALGTNGNPYQWHFFIFTNDQFNSTNQATNFMVTTFLPPDLATQISPRTNGADLDLYVSTNPGLTNLDPTVFAAMTTNDISLSRGGNETVIDTNSYAGEVYYIGVKSEDQQGADFGIYAEAQQAPFSTVNSDGSVTGTAGPMTIPDTLGGPPAILHVFLGPSPLSPQLTLRKITALLSISHDNPSDLYGTLEHNGTQAVLNNYSGPPGGFTNNYNDLNDNTPAGSVHSDGPGSLKSFIGTAGVGEWMLTESDNALLQNGQVNAITLTAYPQPPLIGSFFNNGSVEQISFCIQDPIEPQTAYDDYLIVPNNATNMTLAVTFVSGQGPVGLFFGNQDDLGLSSYGVTSINAPGGLLAYSVTNTPPLDGGVWYYEIYNNSSGPVQLCVTIDYYLNLVPNLVQTFTNNTMVPLPTDATVSTSQICISNGQQLIDLSVGVRLTDPNLDDLTLQLTSPQGTSIVLFENRGGVLVNNLGLTLTNAATGTNSSNYVYTVFTEDTNLADGPIKFAPPPYAVPIVVTLTNIYVGSFDNFTNLEDFYTNGVVTSNAAGIYTNGQSVAGWFVETNQVVVTSVRTNVVTGPTNNPVTNQMTILVTNQVFNEVSVATDLSVTYDGTNFVSSNTVPGTNYVGSNYLALASGHLSQTFTTVAGVAYELVYYARSPGLTDWWPSDDNTIDLIDTNNNGTIPYHDVTFGEGEVARAFMFSGNGQPGNGNHGNEVDFGTNSGNFGTNDFTIDFWIKVPTSTPGLYGVLEKRAVCDDDFSQFNIRFGAGILYDPSALPGQFNFEVTGDNMQGLGQFVGRKVINDGIFHHAAFLRKNTTLAIYVDGILDSNITTAGIAYVSNAVPFRAGQSICVFPGSGFSDTTVPLIGEIDELDLWNRALSPAEIHAIYQAGGDGKYNSNSFYPNFQVAFDGVSTNDVIIHNFAETNWQKYTNSFIATSNQTTVELLGNTLGVLLDDIELIQLPYTNYNNYYLPEEPLAPLIGQNPQGCWTLSVWDSRTDTDLATNGALLSWTLQATTSSTNVDLIVLSSLPNDTYCTANFATNLPPNGGIFYFGVDVPLTANFATNILTGNGPMNLYFNQDALPTGSLPGDVTLFSITNAAGGTGSRTVSTQGAPPPLVPGQRYFLGVQNASSTVETFCLQVNFDVNNNTNITSLTNGLPIDPVIGTNGPQFYSFSVPTNAVMVTFQLLNLTNGEADLYAHEGLPVPGPTSFDYASRNEATNDQFIVITTNSQPVPLPVGTSNEPPLTPTTWYLSVYNPGTNNVGYTILATVVTNGPNGARGAMDIISLNTRSNYTYYETNAPGAPPGFPTNQLYSFTIPGTSLGEVAFTVTNISTNGNLQLLVGKDAFPTPDSSYNASYNSGTNNQLVVIVTNSALPTLSAVWYLAVANTSTNFVKYSITAVVNGVLTQPVIWDGAAGSTWNFTEPDWRPIGGTNNTTYSDTDPVTFDDSLTNGRNTITIPGTVQPGSMTFSNSATNTYTFIGPGSIAGSTGLDILSNGAVILDDSGGNTFYGLITISNGTLQIGANDANGSITASVNNSFPGTLSFNRTDDFTYPGSLSGNGTLVKNDANVLTLTGSNINLSGLVDIAQGTLRFAAPNPFGSNSITISNTISGPGNLIEAGGQPLYLAAANTYTGSTLVASGAIFLINTGFIGTSPSVTIFSNATVDATGRPDMTYRAPNGQTLQSAGNINGSLRIAVGATVAPGTPGATGVLTVSSNVTLLGTAFFKINNTAGGTNDIIVSQGSITYGGALQISNMTTNLFTSGQSFQLFSASNGYFGAFTNIVPASPGPGVGWDTSLLTSNGTLSIVISAPTVTSFSISGTNFFFGGTNGDPNGPYVVLTTANLAQAWTPVATNNFLPNGNFSFIGIYSPTNQQQFYTIERPGP